MPLIKTIKSKYFWGLSKNTFLLAAASLFADISTEMLYPILPIFLTQTLKTGGGVVGIVEGIAQATQNIIQGFSGYISDRFKTRKPLALIGYIFAALSKPLIGISQTWPQVLFARFMDRFGTGTRSAPRDALIADSAPGQFRGKAFGLEGVGDNLGAFLGPIIAIILLFYMSVGIRSIFFLSLIPGLLAVIMIYLVKEEPAKNNLKTRVELIGKKFPKPYLKYLFVISLFGLGNSSNSFLILETKSIGASLELTILIYAFFNLVASFISYPSGSLSDKLGRKNILLLSFIIFIITYIGFALSNNILSLPFFLFFMAFIKGYLEQ